MAETIKSFPAKWETQVQSLGQEDPTEKEKATHFRILAWEIPWTEGPDRLQSMGLQKVGHDWETNTYLQRQDDKINALSLVLWDETSSAYLRYGMSHCNDTKGTWRRRPYPMSGRAVSWVEVQQAKRKDVWQDWSMHIKIKTMETTKNGDGTMMHVVKAGGYILKVITFFFQRILMVSLWSYLQYLYKTQAPKDSLVSKNQIGKWEAWSSSFLTLFSISAHLLLRNYWNRFEVILDAQNFSWQSTQKHRTERNSPNTHYNTSSIILLICFQCWEGLLVIPGPLAKPGYWAVQSAHFQLWIWFSCQYLVLPKAQGENLASLTPPTDSLGKAT